MDIIFVTTDHSWSRFDCKEHELKTVAQRIASVNFEFEPRTKRKAKVLAALNLMRVHGVQSLTFDGVTISVANPQL